MTTISIIIPFCHRRYREGVGTERRALVPQVECSCRPRPEAVNIDNTDSSSVSSGLLKRRAWLIMVGIVVVSSSDVIGCAN